MGQLSHFSDVILMRRIGRTMFVRMTKGAFSTTVAVPLWDEILMDDERLKQFGCLLPDVEQSLIVGSTRSGCQIKVSPVTEPNY